MKTSHSSFVNSPLFSHWWFPALVAVFTVAGLVLVIIPKVQEIITLRQQLSSNKQVLIKEQAKLQAIQEIDEAELRHMVSMVNTALPDKKPLFEVLTQLQNVAALSGVSLGNFELNPGSVASAEGKTQDSKKPTSLDTKLSISGTYEQLNSFFDALQNVVPLFTVNSINISMPNDDKVSEAEELLTASLKINIFFQKLSADVFQDDKIATIDNNTRDIITTLTSYAAVSASDSAIVDYDREDLFNY